MDERANSISDIFANWKGAYLEKQIILVVIKMSPWYHKQ